MAQRQNDTDGHFGIAKKCLSFFFSNSILGFKVKYRSEDFLALVSIF